MGDVNGCSETHFGISKHTTTMDKKHERYLTTTASNPEALRRTMSNMIKQVVVVVESYYFFNIYYCWRPSTTSPPSRLRAVTLSNKSIYKIQLKPVRCRLCCLLLLRFFCASRARILMTSL